MRLPESQPELVRMAAQCSSEAFDALVQRHRPLLRFVARRCADEPADRDDICQEVVAGLLEREKKALRDWRPIAPFSTYLSVIASRRGQRYMRRRGLPRDARQMALPAAEREFEGVLAPETASALSPHAAAEAREFERLVSGALGRLGPRDQMLLRLRFWEGLAPREIAPMVGLSSGTCRKAIFDALQRMERMLTADDGTVPEDLM